MLALFAVLALQVLTADEARDVGDVISAAVKAGFPDGAKAALFSGKVKISATFDPAKEAAPLPADLSTMQMTVPNSTKMTYTYAIDGNHLKFADGSWLLSFAYRFKVREGDSLTTDDAKAIDLATLTADAAKDHPFDAVKEASGWLDKVAPAHRDRAAKAMNQFVPVSYFLKLSREDQVPAIVLLHRAGWTDAAALSACVADQRIREFWLQRPWVEPDFLFDPTGAYPTAKERDDAWKKTKAPFVPETPAAALRRALFRWCQSQLTSEEPALAPEVAAAVCKAMLDPKDPQGHKARVEALLAGAKLPVTVAANADVATRLASWEARPRQPKMKVTGGGNSMQTTFEAPPPAYAPDKKDLDALVALLGDDRPSRFWDFCGPRSLGDNAWRALATLLEKDPRALAGVATEKPWTTAERKSCAAALQRWWKEHRAEFIDK
jgi:hypothetical protein